MGAKDRTSPSEKVVARVQASYPRAVAAVNAYLAPKEPPDPTKTLIAGNPTASELLARGYPQYVAESVARNEQEVPE